MKKQIFLMAGAVFACALSAQAGVLPQFIDWKAGGEWSAYGYMDLRQNSVNDKAAADNQFTWKNHLDWQEQGLSLIADLQWRFQAFRGGMDHHSQGEVRFRDVYAQVKGDQHDLALGQKRITWGKMDDIVILDRVSPQDFRHFVLYDKQERKDPAAMLHYQWFGFEDVDVEAVFMPFFEPSELDFFGTNWAVFGHLKQAVAESPVYSADQKNIVSGIAIQDDSDVTSRTLKNSQAAVRVRGRMGEADYGLYYMNLYNSVPVLREVNPAGNLTKRFLFEPTAENLNALVASGASDDDLRLIKAHPRVNVTGLDWETVVGVFGIRGEAAAFWGMPYLREDFSFTKKDQLSFGFGIDHTTDDQWYVDLQYIQDYVLNYEPLYAVKKAPVAFAGTVSKSFRRGQILLALDWMWQASYSDVMLNPEIVYQWQRAGTDIALGAFIFEGENSNSLFGRYDQNDVVYLKLSGKF